VPVKPYDLIYSFGVIHHTPHPEKVIQQIKKYTHPKTIIKIMVYHRYAWKTLWILLKFGQGAFWKIDQLVAQHSEAATGSPVTYIYSKSQVRKLLKGFKIKEMAIDHIFPYQVAEYKQYRYKKVWYFRYLPQPLFRWLEKHFGWHLCITATAS
jgi:2-polyprenyl-3-methyl-5-hydroxy-6-metoxy-1,4-benzoquinol methylase